MRDIQQDLNENVKISKKKDHKLLVTLHSTHGLDLRSCENLDFRCRNTSASIYNVTFLTPRSLHTFVFGCEIASLCMFVATNVVENVINTRTVPVSRNRKICIGKEENQNDCFLQNERTQYFGGKSQL